MRMTRRTAAALSPIPALLLLAGCTAGPDDAEALPETSTPASTPSPTSTPDPWAGHFEERAAAEAGDHVLQFSGSFGDEGSVATVRNEDRTLPAGNYVIDLTCDGPATVTASFDRLMDEAAFAPSRVLECPSNARLSIDLREPGLGMSLDSDGDVGAYLGQISPGPSIEEIVDACLAEAAEAGPGPAGQIERGEPIWDEVGVALRPDGEWYVAFPFADDEVERTPEFQCRMSFDLQDIPYAGSRLAGEADDFAEWADGTLPQGEGM